MAVLPTVTSIKLRPCCRRALQGILRRQEMVNIWQGPQHSTVFGPLLSTSPPLDAITITTTDWEGWCNAISPLPASLKESCRDTASRHFMNHYCEGDLGKFWNLFAESFNTQ